MNSFFTALAIVGLIIFVGSMASTAGSIGGIIIGIGAAIACVMYLTRPIPNSDE